MHRILNAMRMQASISQNARYFSQLGVISGYDPTTYTAQVLLQPATEDQPALQTGWLPISSPFPSMGNWGLFCPPQIGVMCAVHYQEGSLQNGWIELGFFNNNGTIPEVQSEEFFLIHKSGSALKFKNDGNVEIIAEEKMTFTAKDMDINIQNDLKINVSHETKIDCTDIKMGDLTNAVTPFPAFVETVSGASQNVKVT